MKKILFLLFMAILFPSAATADSPTGEYFFGTQVDCPGMPRAEAAVTLCNNVAYEAVDHELNTAYQNLMALADSDKESYLRNMQEAWVKERGTMRVKKLEELGTGVAW